MSIDEYLDLNMKDAYYELFDKASKVRQELSQVISLVKGSETFQKDSRVARNVEQVSLFKWHLTNLESENASIISEISLEYWDQDDPYDIGGYHPSFPVKIKD